MSGVRGPNQLLVGMMLWVVSIYMYIVLERERERESSVEVNAVVGGLAAIGVFKHLSFSLGPCVHMFVKGFER